MSRPRAVLQVASTKGRGGIVTAIRHYARAFAQCGVPCTTLYRGPALDALKADGVDVVKAPELLFTPLAALAHGRGLRREVEERLNGAPEIIVVHSDKALSAMRALWPRAAIVAPCHSDKFKRKRRADVVVTLNPTQHRAATAALKDSSARPFLLGNPFIPEPTTPPPDGEPRVVFCGRFIDTKDPGLLLRAARHLPVSPRLVFIGAGPLEGALKEEVGASGLEHTFTGWQRRPFDHIAVTDILVLPSSWEGLPYMIQEALAHGVGVVAADNPGNRYALGDGAFGELFPPGDAERLASILERTLAAPAALREKAAHGKAALTERFGPEAFVRALALATSATN